MVLTQPTTSNMVARRGRWTPIVSTPQRDNADQNTIDYIKLFFEDFPGPIASKAVEYAKIFENKGFDSKESLKGITPVDQLGRWIPEGHAIQIVAQILMLFAPVVLPVFTPVGGGAPLTSVAPTHVGSQNARPADVTSDDACPRLATCHTGTALLGVPQVQTTAAGGTNLEIVLKAMMQQQTDFQAQAAASSCNYIH